MSDQSFPAIPDPAPTLEALYTSVFAMKQSIEMLVGTRGTQSVVGKVATLEEQALPYSATASNLIAGYNIATYKIPDTAGVIRLDARRGLLQTLSNGGITDIYAPFNDCDFVMLLTNTVVAETLINWQSFAGGTHGDPLTGAIGATFLIRVTRVDGIASYFVQALQ